MGRLDAKLRAKMVPSWVPRWRFCGSKSEAKGFHEEIFGTLCKINAKAQNYYFPLDFNGFLKFRGPMLRGKIGLGVSWKALGAAWRHPKASWRPLGASYGDLRGISERLRGVWRRV